MILSAKNTTVYTFYWTVSHSYGKQASDRAVVGVIDGDKVLVTNFKDGIVPPPMAQQTIQFKEPVNAISFAPSNIEDSKISSNDFLALMSNNKIVLCKNVNVSHFSVNLRNIKRRFLSHNFFYRYHGNRSMR